MAAHYLDVLSRFADFDGRASRAQFWSFLVVHAAVMVALGLASAVLGVVLEMAWVAGSGVFALYAALTFLPTLSAAARRLHDTGRSSFLLALGAFLPLVLLLAWWMAQPGEPGPNRWGQPSAV